MPTRLEDLAHHVVIGFDRVPAYARNLRIGGQPITREAFNFRCDNDAGQLAALRAGIGIGVCQYGIARRNSDLVPILTREFTLQYDTWVVMHEDQKGVERVRSLFDHLADAMREYCASAGPPRG
jgi:DNA-binding transcriptional LysR family regulator